MIEIEQGTIIYGIKSSKYSSTPCYGIIITARCDIAQHKVPKYYYLVAVDAATWFETEHGYKETFSDIIEQAKENVCVAAQELSLNGEVLLSATQDDRCTILAEKEKQISGDKLLKKSMTKLLKAIKKYCEWIDGSRTQESRKISIYSNLNTAIKHIKNIDAGKHHHYYFLPQAAYLDNNIKHKGLIVDLLEIGVLSLKDAEVLTSPSRGAINYSMLPILPQPEDLPYIKDPTELQNIFSKIPEYWRMKNLFWLESTSDFVAIEGTTKSPWIEHLMQRFSNAFIRIGLDNPSDLDFQNIFANECEEECR